MKQLDNFSIWVFSGAESTQREFRGRAVEPAAWYIGGKGDRIDYGPFPTQARAWFEAGAMIDTSGT